MFKIVHDAQTLNFAYRTENMKTFLWRSLSSTMKSMNVELLAEKSAVTNICP
jgi:hypothetical protein